MSWNNQLKPVPVPSQQNPRPNAVIVEESLLSSHKVLRNTYMLLSLTLLFSAGLAVISMSLNTPALPWWMNLVGMLGLLFWVQAARNSVWGLVAVFTFTGFIGFTTGPLISTYLKHFPNGGQMVAMAAGGTGAIFMALSAYVLTTKKDFSFLSGFLLAGLVVVLIAGVANIFLHMAGFALVISSVSILLFSALILFDTSRIIHGGETNYISATVSLYLDVYNLFLSLLQLTGFLGSDD